MLQLFKDPAQIVSVDTEGRNFKSGREMNDIALLENYSIVVEDGNIKDFIKSKSRKKYSFDEIHDLSGKVVLPGLIECHTHAAFAGTRSDEFRRKLNGTAYEQIANEGGGINTTVKAVRKATFDELVEAVLPRINYFIAQGVTTLEIKSGYGLSFSDEIKQLQVIKHLNRISPINIVSTFLGAHTYPKEYNNDHHKYIDIINAEMLPYVAKHKLAHYCDAFCETTAFSSTEVDRIFAQASENGLKLRLHTDQFNSIGGIDTALKFNALSVDHLEVVNDADIKKVCNSDTTAVLLPGVSFFLKHLYAPARKLIDNGAVVALSTDYNPGSSYIADLNLIMSIASINMRMSMEESISAVTINAAKALDLHNSVGSIEMNKCADFSVFEINDYSEIVYQVAKNLNCMTIKNGKVIYRR